MVPPINSQDVRQRCRQRRENNVGLNRKLQLKIAPKGEEWRNSWIWAKWAQMEFHCFSPDPSNVKIKISGWNQIFLGNGTLNRFFTLHTASLWTSLKIYLYSQINTTEINNRKKLWNYDRCTGTVLSIASASLGPCLQHLRSHSRIDVPTLKSRLTCL